MQPFTKFLKQKIRVAPTISSKGEVKELQEGLVSPYPQTRKDAIKSTIKQMTLGKDMSSLFSDVLKNIATNDIEQKKLVYLYIINYAELYPDLCILAVNTFVSDASDPNPLIRCMAMKAMSLIKNDTILDYIETPLLSAINDKDPYVIKTAVFCVTKLFKMNRHLCLQLNLIEALKNLLKYNNANVVANCIIALKEISNIDDSLINWQTNIIDKYSLNWLNLLDDANEWSKITLLNSISEFNCNKKSDAKLIIKTVATHLRNQNYSVVLSVIKVILNNLEISGQSNHEVLNKKLSNSISALITTSTPYEIQYIILKNINIIITKYPNLLINEVRSFFINTNDPLYVKINKIKVLIKVVNYKDTRQLEQVFGELREYTRDFEIEFSSMAIKGLVELSIKSNNSKCIKKSQEYLLELMEFQDMHTDECLIGLNNLLRFITNENKKFNFDNFLNLIGNWENVELILQNSIAKISYLSLMSQYPENFGDIKSKIIGFKENFLEEDINTQMSIIITVIKLYKYINDDNLINEILLISQKNAIDVDIRDLSIIYQRCLQECQNTGNFDILQKLSNNEQLENITTTFSTIKGELLEYMLRQLGNITTINYLHPNKVNNNHITKKSINDINPSSSSDLLNNNDNLLLDLNEDTTTTNSNNNNNKNTSNSNNMDLLSDIMNKYESSNTQQQQNALIVPGNTNVNNNGLDMLFQKEFNNMNLDNSNNKDNNNNQISTNIDDLFDFS